MGSILLLSTLILSHLMKLINKLFLDDGAETSLFNFRKRHLYRLGIVDHLRLRFQ